MSIFKQGLNFKMRMVQEFMSFLHGSYTNLCNGSSFRSMLPKPEAHTFFIEFYKNDIFIGHWASSLHHIQV